VKEENAMIEMVLKNLSFVDIPHTMIDQ